MIAATRAESCCILDDLNISITDRQSMIIVEAWKSREAPADHFKSAHRAVWRQAPRGCYSERRNEIFHPENVESS